MPSRGLFSFFSLVITAILAAGVLTMPADTRAKTKSRGHVGATGSSADTEENSTTADRSDNSLEGGVTDHRGQNTNMAEAVPQDISDQSIVLLRAKVMAARKAVDDCSEDIAE